MGVATGSRTWWWCTTSSDPARRQSPNELTKSDVGERKSVSRHGEKLRRATHGMRFDAFHDQLAPSRRHGVAAGLVRAHRYRAHALHSGRDDGIDALPCALLCSASSRSGYLHIRCAGLIKKSWNCSLECGAAVAMGPSDAGRLVPGLCRTAPELGVVNTAANESCGRSGAGSRGAGRWAVGATRAPLGGGHADGPGTRRGWARDTPRKGREGVTDGVGGWANERTGEREWVAGQMGG